LAEIAIIACDLAEVIGTAIALQLLFHIPLTIGVCLTALNVVAMIALERRGFRKLEMAVVMLMIVVAGCLLTEVVLSGPSPASIAAGLVPRPGDLADPEMLFIATGIIGATVMPHNLYLHSAVVQTRQVEAGAMGKQEAVRLAILDSVLALSLAMLVNMAILILAASVFHTHGRFVEDIGEAYHLLSPMMGIGAASLLFGLALLASGQNSTLTGTMAGQVVMEGFTRFNMPAVARRALARGLAIIPAMIATSFYGASGTAKLLIASQVVLSLQLPFAIVPLIRLTSDRARMGSFANSRGLALLSWTIALFISGMGAKLLFDILAG
jgi:NRAMP (natural resistance-associated macrophage protein)-like metal ion transporter